MKLSIISPAYNEEQRIRPFLDAYTAYFAEQYGEDVELIIVVNGSSDATAEIARDYAKDCPLIRVIEEPRKIGKGGAIMMGFEVATGDVVGFADADASTPPHAFQDLVERLDGADAVIASRWFKESVVEPRQTLRRRIASRVFNFLVRVFFGLKLWDTQCGAKVMTQQAVQTVLPELGLTRWAFDVDLLFQLNRAGFQIVEAPTVWHDVGGSQLRVGRASFEMFLAICRLRLLHSPFKWVVGIYDRTLGKVVRLHA